MIQSQPAEPSVPVSPSRLSSLAVLTSGGDAGGMNAAVRAVVRTAQAYGIDVYAVGEGYRGLVNGGEAIRRVDVAAVGGILHRGGTVLGTARCAEFRTREGRLRAVRNLVELGIDALVVIGGDGSLTGATVLRDEWPDLLGELVADGLVEAGRAAAHPHLRFAGLVGSIDNDMFGTDLTIGADTALQRIIEALDAIDSTALSHQRTFVVEVMGRHCGYLALMAGLASGTNYVFIPEQPPAKGEWAKQMCARLRAGREIGRRRSLVIVAEGARDRDGDPITVTEVKEILESELGEDVRITILGHVQRGGSPSAFDRYLGTLLGNAAVEHLLTAEPEREPQLVGLRGNRVALSPVKECIEQTRAVAERIREQDFDGAMMLRGGSFRDSYRILQTMQQAAPRPTPVGCHRRFRLVVVHGGEPAPGMNTALRAAVRLAGDRGYDVLAARHGFRGLRDGDLTELDWMAVSGLVSPGGAEIGTSSYVPDDRAVARIAEQLEKHRVDALIMAGGWAGYQAAHLLHSSRERHPGLDIPIACIPLTINNDLPGTELTIGADTALNAIVADVDKIKQSAVAARRCFVIEVMGQDAGYLALMTAIGTGAERVYLPEEDVTLADLAEDVRALDAEFRTGKRLGLVIRSERADPVYTTALIRSVFDREGGDLWGAREAVLGDIQEGGDPSPFDRIEATRLTARAIDHITDTLESGGRASVMVGLQSGLVQFTDLTSFPTLIEPGARRPREQRWLSHRALSQTMGVR